MYYMKSQALLGKLEHTLLKLKVAQHAKNIKPSNSIFLFHNKHRANIEQKIKTQPQRITPFRKTKVEQPEVRIFLQGSRETSGIIEAYHHAHATWTGRVLIRFVESGLILFQV
ncbi:hypothetical protein ACJX0J_018738 [Zea mays]